MLVALSHLELAGTHARHRHSVAYGASLEVPIRMKPADAEGAVNLFQGAGHALWYNPVLFAVEQPYAIIGKVARVVDHTSLPSVFDERHRAFRLRRGRSKPEVPAADVIRAGNRGR